MTRAQVDYCRDRAKVIVINDNYLLAPWADVLYACDPHWFDWHFTDGDVRKKIIDNYGQEYLIEYFSGRIVTQDKPNIQHAEKYGLEWLHSEPGRGLCTDPTIIHQGANSGFQAINLAYHLGARDIVLIGYDMQFGKNNEAHWFGEHPNNVRSGYPGFIESFRHIANQLEHLKLKITNCTIETALPFFDRAALEETL